MAHPSWFVDLARYAARSAPAIAQATDIPVVGPILRALLRFVTRHDDAIYLPKDHVIAVHTPVASAESLVLPSQVVEHFVRQARFRWIMNRCLCRSASECRDYPVDLGCLFLGDAARQINPSLGRPATVEEALDHVARARQLGLVHMIGRHTLDSHWLGARPAERLMTICSCCPCCCVIGQLQHVPPQARQGIAPMPGVHVRVTERCTGCGTCTQGVCFTNAITIPDGHAVIAGLCLACGRCVEACPNQALELCVADEAYVETAIHRLERRVDVR